MTSFLSRLLFSVFLFLPFLAYADTTETYTLDPGHSYVSWQINHFGFSNPSGKWLANGTLSVDEKKPQNSKVNVVIKVADVVTGIPKLDEHLRNADFFDTDKYPDATYVSDKIVVTGKDTAKLYGTLTLHGVSKPVTLNVKLNKSGVSPITNKKTAGFTATADLKRSDFGITKYLPGLGDKVKLNIEVEAAKENTNSASSN
jgi:polyisoprenoid-binding protein YceI